MGLRERAGGGGGQRGREPREPGDTGTLGRGGGHRRFPRCHLRLAATRPGSLYSAAKRRGEVSAKRAAAGPAAGVALGRGKRGSPVARPGFRGAPRGPPC